VRWFVRAGVYYLLRLAERISNIEFYEILHQESENALAGSMDIILPHSCVRACASW
jgi:hypothetical protein